MGNPTDPDAGTNRTDAVSRDNLMNEVSLGYSGIYVNGVLDDVSASGSWWSSTIDHSTSSYASRVANAGSNINPQNSNQKRYGRSVR